MWYRVKLCLMYCMSDEIQFTQYIHPFSGQLGRDEVWLDHKRHEQFHHRFFVTISSPYEQRSSGLHLPQMFLRWTLEYGRFWSRRSVLSHTLVLKFLNGNWSNRGKKSMVKLSVPPVIKSYLVSAVFSAKRVDILRKMYFIWHTKH